MTLKTKLFAPLFVILMLGMATSAFADLTCAITVANVAARDIANGHWENTGDLVFTCSAPNATPTTVGSLTISYGLPITNSRTVGTAGHLITLTNQTGLFAATPVIFDTTRTDTGTSGVSNSGGLIGLTIPAQTAPAGTSTFTVANVLLSLAGGTTVGQTDLRANVNVLSTSGNTTLTNTTPIIVSSVLSALASSGANAPALATGTTPAQFTAAGAPLGSTAGCTTQACIDARARFTVNVSEDHMDSWRTASQYYNNGAGSAANGTDVQFNFQNMVPGSVISNCVLIPPAGTTWNLSGSGIANAAGNATFVAELQNTGATNLAAVETLGLSCGTSAATPAYNPGTSTTPASANITVTMNQAPLGTALPSQGGPSASTAPRYQAGTTVGPVTVIIFSGASTGQTTLIVPWATGTGAAAPPAGTFNTGIVVANTTKDPASFGANEASDSAGSVTFNFFPADGGATFAITPTTGFNLSGGVVPAGGSFIGLVSDILKAGNVSTSFTGYIIVVANFTHAHGSAFVFGGVGASDRITSAQAVLVINNPSFSARNLFGAVLNAETTGR
jgi:hypothetical protein